MRVSELVYERFNVETINVVRIIIILLHGTFDINTLASVEPFPSFF